MNPVRAAPMWSYEGELGRMLEDCEASVLDKAAQKDRDGPRTIYCRASHGHGMASFRWRRRHGDTVDVKQRRDGTIDIRVRPPEV